MTLTARLRPRSFALGVAAVASVAAVALAGCSSSSSSSSEIVLIQDAPALTTIEVSDGPETSGGASHGDILAFEAPVSRDGEVVGDLSGILTTVDIPLEGSDGREVFEERIGTLVFRFSDTDSIVVNGSSVYPAGEDEMAPGTPQIRAVLGGTGSYVGVDGEVSTVRNDDGTYTHTLTLLNLQ